MFLFRTHTRIYRFSKNIVIKDRISICQEILLSKIAFPLSIYIYIYIYIGRWQMAMQSLIIIFLGKRILDGTDAMYG